jgi:hypothetical protein
MRSYNAANFDEIIDFIVGALASAPDVHVGEWQAIRSDDLPQSDTIEVEDISFSYRIPATRELLAEAVRPNLPWAELHFDERVSGTPWNPPPSHELWPFAQRSNEEHVDESQRFSHTYPERFWPKFAGDAFSAHRGIRYNYGDLADVLELLGSRPGTRQAYLPVFFPEDTGAVENQRIPCTIGYHFLLRGERLKIVYYIRSCDFYRHFRDDAYMAARLCQWVAEQIKAVPGQLVMHISSMHIFSAERSKIKAEAEMRMTKNMGVLG